MSSTRTLLRAAALVAAAFCSVVPAASAATTRYASVEGLGTSCTADAPCDVVEAIQNAAWGDEVVVAPGDYPITATVQDPGGVTIHGVDGQPRPRLQFSGDQWGLRLDYGTTLRHVEIDQAYDSVALHMGDAKADGIVIRSAGWGAEVQSSTIANSLVITTRASAFAIATSTNGAANTSHYRNVTAVATAAGGVGILADGAGAAGKATVNATNVIAIGGAGGASARAWSSTGGQATVNLVHSSAPTWVTTGDNAAVVDGGGNLELPPAFVDAAAGDYRQALGSPTIDAGMDDPLNGAADLDGDPRTVGTTDIGADEYLAAPLATTGDATAITTTAATLDGSADPRGVATTYRFEYGPTAAYGNATAAVDAGSGAVAVAASAALAGLAPATTYHYRLVATSAGGTVTGADRTFTTAAAPVADPAPGGDGGTLPAGDPGTPPAAAFAGVTVRAARLAKSGRFVLVTATCPAGAPGGCRGAVTVAAKTLRLGRARFTARAGARIVVRVRLSAAGRRALAGGRRLAVKVTVSARDGAGASRTTGIRASLRRRA